jgi:hypothetical protein
MRMTRAKKIGLALLAIVAAVVGYFGWYYFGPPPMSRAEIDATIAELEAIASEIENRPTADREALEAIFKENESWLTADEVWPWRWDSESLSEPPAAYLANLENLKRLNAALDAMLEDGLVLQQSMAVGTELSDFVQLRQIMRWETMQSVWGPDPVAALDRSLALSLAYCDAGFFEAAMFGRAMVGYTYLGLMQTMPRLTVEQRAGFADRLERATLVIEAVAEGLRAEEAERLVLVSTFSLAHCRAWKDTPSYSVLWNVLTLDFIRQRERDWYAFYARGLLDEIGRWAAVGGASDWPQGDLCYFRRSLWGLSQGDGRMVMDPLSNVIARQARTRAAMIDALRRLNEEGVPAEETEWPVGDGCKLVVSPASASVTCPEPDEAKYLARDPFGRLL